MTSEMSIVRYPAEFDSTPPAGADPAAIWRVPVAGTIGSVVPDDLGRHLNELRMEGSTVGSDEYVPEWRDEQIAVCPQCGASTELTVVGRWGEPGGLECPQGHVWELADADVATRLLQHLVSLAVERGLVAVE
ncbi:hypothetical protein ACJ6WD_40435 [Streptomyces sp. VTCC 41912]|uniref:hypothetical protein n=1 Tax=Streptomyces sp. VTCC 41912 TaxID=3383243 RepID=UPI003896E800